MIEDKLTAEQRIRLEAVAQANLRLGPRVTEMPDRAVTELLAAGDRIATYIGDGSGVPR